MIHFTRLPTLQPVFYYVTVLERKLKGIKLTSKGVKRDEIPLKKKSLKLSENCEVSCWSEAKHLRVEGNFTTLP
jgi:hypothetical protein